MLLLSVSGVPQSYTISSDGLTQKKYPGVLGTYTLDRADYRTQSLVYSLNMATNSTNSNNSNNSNNSTTSTNSTTSITSINTTISIIIQSLQVKNFKCTECGYSCYLKTDLERHINNVHDKFRSPCPICGKKYSDLRQHVRIVHEGAKVGSISFLNTDSDIDMYVI